MHDNCDQEVEEDRWNVLDARRVEDQLMGSCGTRDRNGDVVVQCDEERRERWRHLEHESDDEDHRDAGDDVGMILNNKIMAQDWRILVRCSSLDSHGGRLIVDSIK